MRMMKLAVAGVLLLLASTPAFADDWLASKLRGKVLQLVEGSWEPLERGAVVPDDRVIRTMRSGRVTLVRGNETLELGGDTQIQIADREGGRPFTTVTQYFGTVGVEAEVREVQHFAVRTPYLVAVVKGTRFSVTSGAGASKVQVQRGAVAVEQSESGAHTVVVAGQAAEATEGEMLHVRGRGDLPPVVTPNGRPAQEEARGRGKSDDDKPGKGADDARKPEKPGKGEKDDKDDKHGKADKPGKEDKSGKSEKDDKPGKGDDGPKGHGSDGRGDKDGHDDKGRDDDKKGKKDKD